jgi:hypothetical protein
MKSAIYGESCGPLLLQAIGAANLTRVIIPPRARIRTASNRYKKETDTKKPRSFGVFQDDA